MAERTGLEPATPGVTGRYSNRLNYRSMKSVGYYLLHYVFTTALEYSLFKLNLRLLNVGPSFAK